MLKGGQIKKKNLKCRLILNNIFLSNHSCTNFCFRGSSKYFYFQSLNYEVEITTLNLNQRSQLIKRMSI